MSGLDSINVLTENPNNSASEKMDAKIPEKKAELKVHFSEDELTARRKAFRDAGVALGNLRSVHLRSRLASERSKAEPEPDTDLSGTPKLDNQKTLSAQEHLKAQKAIDDNKKLAILAAAVAGESVEHVQQVAKLMKLINRAIHDAF